MRAFTYKDVADHQLTEEEIPAEVAEKREEIPSGTSGKSLRIRR